MSLRFRFEAVNAEGTLLQGSLEAEDARAAARELERRGLGVVTVVGEQRGGRRRAPGPLSARHLTLALHELATLLKSGVSLLEAVRAQAEGAQHPDLQQAFEKVTAALRHGGSFSGALADSGLPLPGFVPVLIQAGEQAGALGEALDDAVTQMNYGLRIRNEIRQALIYPCVLIGAGVAAVVIMFAFVVPRFAHLLKQADDMPWLGWAVLSGGMFLREQGVWLLLGAALTVPLVARGLAGRGLRERLLDLAERLPVVGPWRVEMESATWAQIVATLLGHRVPLLNALKLGQAAVSSPRRRTRLEEVARAVRGGTPLAEALEQQQTLSPTGYNLVRVGERSGELPAMLRSLGSLCDEAGKLRMQQFLALLEPVAILLIGSVVGLVMTGIILAITSAHDLAF